MDITGLLILLLVVVLYSFQALFVKLYADANPNGPEKSTQVFCVIESVVIVLVTLAFKGFQVHFSLQTVLLGALTALCLFVFNITQIQAGQRGSYAFMTMVIPFGGLLGPILYSAIFLGEAGALTPLKWLAVGVMMIAFVLMNIGGLELKGAGWIYYLCCGLLFLSNALYCVFLKMQDVFNPSESKELVIVTFFLMGIMALCELLWKNRKKEEKKDLFALPGKAWIYLFIGLFSAAFAVNVLVLALSRINVVVVYAVNNGGVMLLSALFALFIFKEKLSTVKGLGILLAILSIVALSV